jgi:predicted metalloprotease
VGGGLGALAVTLIILLLGGNPDEVMQNLQISPGSSTQQETRALTAEEREMGEFVSVILADTEDVWNTLLSQNDIRYREPRLVLFTDAVSSACGFAQAATGPFYCTGDEKVYIDLGFFRAMQRHLGARGDFAIAYVIAHEIGHHVQNLLGIMERVQAKRAHLSERQFNQYLVRLELQADFLAGVWAHHAQKMKNILEEGDIEEGMNAAAAVGDDRMQRRQTGMVVPDAFTHGSSKQRMRWFLRGLKSGDVRQGNTFATDEL